MIVAAITDTGYKVLLVLHILALIVAFAPSFVWPFVSMRLRKQQDANGAGVSVGKTINDLAGGNTLKIHGPAFALAGLFGFGLIGMSDKAFEFSQTWVSIGMLLWFLGLGVMFGLMAPAETRAQQGDEAAETRLTMYGGMMHLLLLLLVLDMVFKPGL